MLKSSKLQELDESTYTRKWQLGVRLLITEIVLGIIFLLCWLEFVPQISGGVEPPGLVTEKVSVKH